jgi:hypothetical protein
MTRRVWQCVVQSGRAAEQAKQLPKSCRVQTWWKLCCCCIVISYMLGDFGKSPVGPHAREILAGCIVDHDSSIISAIPGTIKEPEVCSTREIIDCTCFRFCEYQFYLPTSTLHR